jgi:hypothetical protein
MTTYEKSVSQHMALGQEDSGITLTDSHVREQSITQVLADSLDIDDSGIGFNLRAALSDSCAMSQGGSALHANELGVIGARSVVIEPPLAPPPAPSGLPSNPTANDATIDTVDNVLPIVSGCGFTPVNYCRLVCTEYYSGQRTTAASAAINATLIKLSTTNLLAAGVVISFGNGLLTYTVVSSVVNGANTDVTITPALKTTVANSMQVRLLVVETIKRPQYSTAANTAMAVAANSSFDGNMLRYGANRPIMQTLNLRLILESEAKRLTFLEFIRQTVGYVVEISTNLYGGQPVYANMTTPIVEFNRLLGDGICTIWGTSLSFLRKIQ